MAHNLNEINGDVSFFTVKEKAWHGLGKVLDQCPTSEEAIKLANLTYKVEKVSNYAFIDGDYSKTPSSFSTYRTDNGVILGDKLGRNYTIVQNTEAFKFFDTIVGSGEAIYETAGALGKGEVVFITAKLPSYIKVGNKDNIEKYLLLTMAHDGSGSIQALFTPIRVVCNNTLTMALSQSTQRVSIRHTRSAEANLAMAQGILKITNMLSEELETIYNRISKIKIDDKFLNGYIEQVFLSPDRLKELKEGKELSNKILKQFEEVKEYYEIGPGQNLDTCKGTLFGAYNAITGYFSNIKEFKNADQKMQSNYLGSGNLMMKKALELAIKKNLND